MEVDQRPAFGDFRLDLASERPWSGGEVVALTRRRLRFCAGWSKRIEYFPAYPLGMIRLCPTRTCPLRRLLRRWMATGVTP